MATSPLELAFIVFVVLLPVVIGMGWVTWISMGRMANLASRGLGMAEEMQRHAWSADLSKEPERAQVAAQLETVGHPAYVPSTYTNYRPPEPTMYPDEVELSRA